MGIVTTDDKNYVNIANAIRGKTGKTGLLSPPQMASEISNITSGGEAIENEQYIRPTEWLAMPEHDTTKDEILVLIAVYPFSKQEISIYTQGNADIYIGDIDNTIYSNVSSGTINFTYDYNNIADDTFYYGYRQVILKVVAEKGALTHVSFSSKDVFALDFRLYSNSTTITVRNSFFKLLNNYELHFSENTINPYIPKGTPVRNIEFENVILQKNLKDYMNNMRKLLKLPSFVLVDDEELIMQGTFNTLPMINLIENISVEYTKNISYIFYWNTNLKEIKNFATGKPSNVSRIFEGCNNLLNVPPVDTSEAITMNDMYKNCYKIKQVEFSIKNATTINNICDSCSSLEKITVLDHVEKENGSLSGQGAFRNNTKLTELDFNTLCLNNAKQFLELTNIKTFNANFKYCTTANSAFYGCSDLMSLYDVNLENSIDNFNFCTGCIFLYYIEFSTPQCIKANINFNNCSSLSAEMLNYIFETGLADLTGETAQTITITGAGGAYECDVSIAQSKNWTVVR